MHHPLVCAVIVTAWLALPAIAAAQAIDVVATRAAGMSGAFVAAADDASAVYWNPGALATGSYFSLVMDRTEGRTATSEPAAGSRSGFLIALAAPAMGLSYYRLRSTALTPLDLLAGGGGLGPNVGPGQVRLDSLVTHHVGATLVQSLSDGIALGATLKLVRGTAVTGVVADTDRKALLADGVDVLGRSGTKFDVDLGVLARVGSLRAGVTVRNVTEPEFASAEAGRRLRLERQARAGVALQAAPGWVVAADADLLDVPGPFGDSRDVALGTEARVARRAFVRGGVRVNMLGDTPPGRAPSVSLGGSFAVRASVLVDAQVTTGADRSSRGWGLGARFVY